MTTADRMIDKMLLLGFCEGAIPLITETAHEMLKCNTFDIVQNIEPGTPRHPWKIPGFAMAGHHAAEYDFDANPHKAYFGVFSAHIKYIVYHYFKKFHGIDKSRYLSLVHPLARLSNHAICGPGMYTGQLSNISPFAKTGFGVSILSACTIGHHAGLGDFVNISPGVNIPGGVTIGEATEIGAGAVVLNNVQIGRHCLVGAGSVVTKNLPDGVVAYGNPCKIIRENERWRKAADIVASF